MYTREQVVEKSTEYFNGDTLAAGVFTDKYALSDGAGNYFELTPDDMHRRLAKEFARIESKYPNAMSEEEIFNSISKFQHIIPQGSPMAAIGNDYQIQSTSNCFVIDSPKDSYGGICKTDQELVQLAKRRSGIGFNISNIRPKGVATKNAARTTDGIGIFMERFSNSCREVAQNSRRGALLMALDVRHPEIETFINIKKDKTKVTGANISIILTDDFMESVKSNSDYEQRWPIDSENPTIVKKVNAKNIWNQIIHSAWESAEPGLLFWGNVQKNTPSDIYSEFKSISTNPCGEINLSKNDSCRLISTNLLSFVDNKFQENAKFNFDKFGSYVYKAQRLMDDLIDLELESINKIIKKIESDPEDDDIKAIELNLWKNVYMMCEKGRRTGLGITALGDTLAAIGVRYGSKESVIVTEEIYKALCLNAYKSTIDMAESRGSFSVFDYEKEKDHKYLSKIISELPKEYQDKYKKYGRRNIALTTTAPMGSGSLLSQTSSGIEPVFKISYKRRRKIMEGSNANVDYIDAVGDKWQEYKVYHHQFSEWSKLTGKILEEESPWYKATSEDVDWETSVDLQAAAQRWIDHSISKTCNLPNDATEELVANVYMKAWETGCKGFTVYRDGCRDGVLVSDTPKETKSLFVENHAPKRPEVLSCEIHQVKIKGESWTIMVGIFDGRPFEVFGGKSKYVSIPKKIKTGFLIKNSKKKGDDKSVYDLKFGEDEDPTIIKDVAKVFENPTEGEFTRLLSLALRHGSPVVHVVEQLQKEENSDMYSFSRVVARVLKGHIKEGTTVSQKCPSCGAKLVFAEGCKKCSENCGYSACS